MSTICAVPNIENSNEIKQKTKLNKGNHIGQEEVKQPLYMDSRTFHTLNIVL